MYISNTIQCIILMITLLFIQCYCRVNPKDSHPHEGENLVINVGLPKSGTESLHFALESVGIKSAHYLVDPRLCSMIYPVKSVTVGGHLVNQTTYPRIQSGLRFVNSKHESICSIGVVMQYSLSKYKPPLFNMIVGGYRGFAELDYIDSINEIAIMPMYEMIDEFFKFYPKAHFIHTRRVFATTHVASMAASYHILEKMKKTGLLKKFPEQANLKSDFDKGVYFVERVTNITIQAFKKRPDIKFLDLCIDCPGADPQAKLRSFLGLPVVLQHTHATIYDSKHTAAPTPAKHHN